MTWEVHEVHERLYPDQGWTPAKAILEDEKHLHDADHPDANGWPIWHFRHSRPDEGSGSGVLPDCPIVDIHTHAWSIALRLVCVLISETTSALRRLTPVRSMAFESENASLVLQNR